MPDADAAPAGGAALCDIDLLALERRLEASASEAPCLIHVGRLPVGRARLPVGRSGVVDAGALRTTASGATLSGSIARALARHVVEALPYGGSTGIEAAIRAARQAPPTMQLPSVTMAICTRDRPLMLARALEAMSSQLTPDVDLLVVENAPSDSRATAHLRERFPQARFVVAPEPGLDRARNRALAESTADLVAFADDDTVVSDGWATAIRQAFAGAPEAAVICGLVEPLQPGTDGAAAIDAYGGMRHGYARRWTFAPGASRQSLLLSHGITSSFGSGACMAVRREPALAMGGFDVALDAGTPAAAGGDLELMFRAIKAGHAVCYEPAIILRHEHRATLDAAIEQAGQWGCGLGAYLARTAAAYPEERLAARVLTAWLLAAWYGRRGAWSWVHPSLPRRMLWSDVRGLLRGARRYRESARNAPAPAAPRAPAVGEHRAVDDREVDIGSEGIPSLWIPDAAMARITVRLASRVLGTVELRPVRGVIGSARIVDAIVDSFRTQVLGVDDRTAGAALLGLMGKNQRTAEPDRLT